jgi:hypothetical protein
MVRRGITKRAWMPLVCLGILMTQSAATRADSSTLVIRVQPPGSVLELKGPQHTVAASPNQIPRPPDGWYELRATYPGYESWKQKLYINRTSPEAVSGALSPKTRFKAGLRSIAFPGWGQYYSDRKGRGAVITLIAVGAAGGYLYLDNRSNKKFEEYEALKAEFNNEKDNPAEKDRLATLVQAARSDAYDAETDKRNWGWGAVAFYAYQVADAIVFFPETTISVQGVQFGLRPAGATPLTLGAAYEF